MRRISACVRYTLNARRLSLPYRRLRPLEERGCCVFGCRQRKAELPNQPSLSLVAVQYVRVVTFFVACQHLHRDVLLIEQLGVPYQMHECAAKHAACCVQNENATEGQEQSKPGGCILGELIPDAIDRVERRMASFPVQVDIKGSNRKSYQ